MPAIKDYLPTLDNISFLAGTNLAKNRVVKMFFKSFEKSCHLREVKSQAWTVTLVLRNLTYLFYEHLELSSDRHLTDVDYHVQL